MTIKLGVIGFAGKQGREHLATLDRMNGVEICGGVDIADGAGDVADSHGFPLFRSTDEMLRRCVMDACFVTVPHHLHASIALKLVERRVPVLKEKPLAMNEADATMLLDAALREDTPVITLTQRAFRSDFLFAREKMAELGVPVWFSYDYHANIPVPTSGWRARREFAVGGVLLDMGYHALDVLTLWFGEVFEASGDLHYIYSSSHDETLEDIANIRLNTVGHDCTGNLQVLRHSDRKHESFEVHCTGGVVRMAPREALVTVTPRGAPEKEVVRRFTSDKVALNRSVLTEALTFIARPDDWLAHMRRHLANVRLCERIYDRASLGSDVQVSDDHALVEVPPR